MAADSLASLYTGRAIVRHNTGLLRCTPVLVHMQGSSSHTGIWEALPALCSLQRKVYTPKCKITSQPKQFLGLTQHSALHL